MAGVAGIDVDAEGGRTRLRHAGNILTCRRVETGDIDLRDRRIDAVNAGRATDLNHTSIGRVDNIQLRALGLDSHFSFLLWDMPSSRRGISGTDACLTGPIGPKLCGKSYTVQPGFALDLLAIVGDYVVICPFDCIPQRSSHIAG